MPLGARRWLLLSAILSLPAAGCSTLGGNFGEAKPQVANQSVAAGTGSWLGMSSWFGKSNTLSPEQTARACVTTAEELERHSHWVEAAKLYEKARANEVSLTFIPRRLAVLYDRQGDAPRAQAEYERALTVSPNDAGLLNDYGYFHVQRGDLAQAEQFIRRSLEVDPTSKRAWVNLGIALGRQGRYQDSFAAFERAVGPAAAHSNVGVLLAKAGHRDLAQQAFQRAAAMDSHLQQPQAFLAHLQRNPPPMSASTYVATSPQPITR
jgi:Tfp pilus assembly protein PilF